jgi:hypothetical protein
MEFRGRPEEFWGLLLEEFRGMEELFGSGGECVPVVGERRGGEIEIGARFRRRRRFRRGGRDQTTAEMNRRLRSQTC